MAGSTPPPGWQPIGNGAYRNPASGTVIYPNGRGGWTGDPQSGVGQGALGRANAVVDEGGLSASHGLGPHGALRGNAGRVAGMPGGMTHMQVLAMQRFLVNHGFNIAQDGIYGPITKAAAAAFRKNHNGGEAFNAAHGLGVHPADRSPVPRAGSGFNGGNTNENPGGTQSKMKPDPTMSAFNKLLASLLAGGGAVGTNFDAQSFGNAAAAPDEALASQVARQIAANPSQEAQNQFDISSWYGLDPSEPNYGLSVLGRLDQARDKDVQANTDAQANVSDIAKSLAGSIGGAANGASGSVLAAGADAAGMFGALGQEAKDYADTLNPLLVAEARGQMSREKAANSQALLGLQDQLAQARGQATADRAQGVETATDKNNGLAQQRFANQGNLLSILSQMMAVDPNQGFLNDAKSVAEISKIIAQTKKINNPTAKQPNTLNLSTAYRALQQLSGGSLTPGSAIPTDQHVALAQNIATVLQSMGIAKSNPLYKAIGDQIFGSFVDQHGRPLVAPPSWAI
jgi:hypothetical protein